MKLRNLLDKTVAATVVLSDLNTFTEVWYDFRDEDLLADYGDYDVLDSEKNGSDLFVTVAYRVIE